MMRAQVLCGWRWRPSRAKEWNSCPASACPLASAHEGLLQKGTTCTFSVGHPGAGDLRQVCRGLLSMSTSCLHGRAQRSLPERCRRTTCDPGNNYCLHAKIPAGDAVLDRHDCGMMRPSLVLHRTIDSRAQVPHLRFQVRHRLLAPQEYTMAVS
eukprot:scaffold884_cov398-Prasinococcus_capsulatus_cf.AAC.20